MNREQYLEYVDHFNHRRYDAITGYFTPDVIVEFYDDATYTGTPARTLHGIQAFTDNYKSLHKHTREVLELGMFMTGGDLLFAELYTEFQTFKDSSPSYPRAPKKKGEISLMTNWVIYNVVGDKMKHVRVAHFRMHDPKTAKFSI